LFTQIAVIRVLLLVVSLAVECLISEEAGVFQRLATSCTRSMYLSRMSSLHPSHTLFLHMSGRNTNL